MLNRSGQLQRDLFHKLKNDLSFATYLDGRILNIRAYSLNEID